MAQRTGISVEVLSDLGLAISTTDARTAEAFTDALSLLWRFVRHGVFAIDSALSRPTRGSHGRQLARRLRPSEPRPCPRPF